MLLSQPFRGSCDEPSPLVNIEFHQAFVSHFQQEGLAGFLIHDIGAFHDFVHFERLLAERAQNIFPIIQHDWTPTVTERVTENTKADLPWLLAQYSLICS